MPPEAGLGKAADPAPSGQRSGRTRARRRALIMLALGSFLEGSGVVALLGGDVVLGMALILPGIALFAAGTVAVIRLAARGGQPE